MCNMVKNSSYFPDHWDRGVVLFRVVGVVCLVVGVKGEMFTKKKAKIFKAHPSCPREPLST